MTFVSIFRCAGTRYVRRVGVVVMATITGLRTGGRASSAPAALSAGSSGYCALCTWAPLIVLRCCRLSRMARIQGGTSLLVHVVTRRAVRARVRRIFKLRSCVLRCSAVQAVWSKRFGRVYAVVLVLQRRASARQDFHHRN